MDHVPGFRDLLARAHQGDRAAIDELFSLIRPWIEQTAQQHVAHRRTVGSVSDLVQEALLRAWQKLDQFHGAEDEAQALVMFRAWLARIVVRLGLNAVRDAGAQQRKPPGKLLSLNGVRTDDDSAAALDPSAGEPTPSAAVLAEEQAQLVRESLARLVDPLDREIIQLRFYEGFSLRQIAQRLGSNPETIRLRFHAILNRLLQELHRLF